MNNTSFKEKNFEDIELGKTQQKMNILKSDIQDDESLKEDSIIIDEKQKIEKKEEKFWTRRYN